MHYEKGSFTTQATGNISRAPEFIPARILSMAGKPQPKPMPKPPKRKGC